MLNELLLIAQGMEGAVDLDKDQRHPDIGDAAKKATLVVQLDESGIVSSAYPLASGITPWTMRNGKHNSFPFVNLSTPLWVLDDATRENFIKFDKKDADGRFKELERLAPATGLNAAASARWPGDSLLESLQARMTRLKTIVPEQNAYVVRATVERFILATTKPDGGKALLEQIAQAIANGLRQNGQSDRVDLAAALLIGKKDKKTNRWVSEGAVLFEAQGFASSIADPRLVGPLSRALLPSAPSKKESEADKASGVCALTGTACGLHAGNYPQPTLPAGLGPSYLCAVKNTAIPASGRYGRFASNAFPVGREIILKIDAAIRELTAPERKGITWWSSPSEAPKKTDLLLAFVHGCPDAPVAGMVADTDVDADFSQEESSAAEREADSIAAYEQRTKRVIGAAKAKSGDDFTQTPVDVMVLRKLDPANRKVVYTQSVTVGNLKAAADDWVEGERYLPHWLSIPSVLKKKNALGQVKPPHVSPMGLIGFCKKTYLDGGKKCIEAPGIPASEALRLFLDVEHPSKTRIAKFLRLVLARRSALVSESVHAKLVSESAHAKWLSQVKDYDFQETLRAATVLGILLHKFHGKETNYMENAAFKLGQLLAAVDMVHLGYCEAVRGGDVPRSLLGNQILSTASSHPIKALSMLCQRWKPYAAWVKVAVRDKPEKQGGGDMTQKDWNIKKALRYAREAEELARELNDRLTDVKVNDAFRAELLLGYMAGLPPLEKKETNDSCAPVTGTHA